MNAPIGRTPDDAVRTDRRRGTWRAGLTRLQRNGGVHVGLMRLGDGEVRNHRLVPAAERRVVGDPSGDGGDGIEEGQRWVGST
jgi:hypothetical protein